MTRRNPICTTCNDTGAVKGPGGVDACPDCAALAEEEWRLARVASEQSQSIETARAARRGKHMDRAA